MPKPKKPEGFEVLNFSDKEDREYKDPRSMQSTIQEVVNEMGNKSPGYGFHVSFFNENMMRLTSTSIHLYVIQRIKQVEDEIKSVMEEAARFIKKEYRQRRGKALELKEDRSKRDQTIEKANMHERFIVKSYRFYELNLDSNE